MITISENHGGEGEAKAGAKLMRRRAAKVIINLVFKNPNDETNQDEESETRHPEVPRQRL